MVDGPLSPAESLAHARYMLAPFIHYLVEAYRTCAGAVDLPVGWLAATMVGVVGCLVLLVALFRTQLAR